MVCEKVIKYYTQLTRRGKTHFINTHYTHENAVYLYSVYTKIIQVKKIVLYSMIEIINVTWNF